jgi:hypothetical protein
MATQQQMFDRVFTRFVIEGKAPSIQPVRGSWHESLGEPAPMECVYLGPNDCRCAVGALLPEQLTFEQRCAVSRCERRGADDERVVEHLYPLIGAQPEDAEFLVGLQVAHDSAANEAALPTSDYYVPFRPGVRTKLVLLAEKFGLTVPEHKETL